MHRLGLLPIIAKDNIMALSVYLFLLLSFICIANTAADPLDSFCNDQSLTSNRQVLANIDNLLSKLVQTTPQTGFSATSCGKSKDQKVYSLAQCRADVSSKDCSTCIQEAAKEIRIRCSNQTDAQIWYDQCFLRYSAFNDFWGQVDTGFGSFSANVQNVTEPETFNKKLGALVDGIGSRALMPENKGFGKGKSNVSLLVDVYALVECTRDLSPFSCAQCLATAFRNFQTFCDDSKGCQVLYRSCHVRYEIYPFF